MSTHDSDSSHGTTLVSIRTMDIVVALLLIALASVFMFDSWRTGFGWIEGHGPGPGFFPFYISLILALASLVTLVRAAFGSGPGSGETFVSTTAFKRVLMVLLPTVAYVALIQYLGIYVSSAIFIVGFMLAFREHFLKAVLVGIAAPVALFLMFERWFLVPLPKGPIEAMLGY